jgi:hypothetical protein
LLDQYAYLTNSASGLFSRVPQDLDATASKGPVEVIEQTGTFLDDFALARDGTAYVVTDLNNTVLKITPDGKVSVVAGSERS